jgi:hypothetical protein
LPFSEFSIVHQHSDFISEYCLSKKSVTSLVTYCSARNCNGKIHATAPGSSGHFTNVQARLSGRTIVDFLADKQPDIVVRTTVSTLIETGLGSLKHRFAAAA